MLKKIRVNHFCEHTVWQLQLQFAREMTYGSSQASLWKAPRKSDSQQEETDPEVGGEQNSWLVHHTPF